MDEIDTAIKSVSDDASDALSQATINSASITTINNTLSTKADKSDIPTDTHIQTIVDERINSILSTGTTYNQLDTNGFLFKSK